MVASEEIVHRSHLTTEIVLQRDKVALLRYAQPARSKTIPVLFVPALISRPAILDLAPGRSMIEATVNAGFTTYLLDWGIHDRSSAEVSLATLVCDYLHAAVERVRESSRGGSVALVGYCMGGTLSTTYAALTRLGDSDRLVTIAAPIDFRHGGKLARWCAPDVLDLERVLALYGAVPAHLVEAVFTTLRPTSRWRAMLDPRPTAAHLALQRWARTWSDFPAAAARDWIGWYYRENRLYNGDLTVRQTPARLEHVRAPLLALAASDDEIAPPASVTPLADAVGSDDRTSVTSAGGHIALVAGSSAGPRTWQTVIDWLSRRDGRRRARRADGG